ncbi:hypothetical protein GCM10025866_33370 [Naasia aerilata]|uniref:RNA-binding S4 domain-containing protein n=1 Tax=Naasia aerilata TaxID=1162966 RepID=A0ABN6XR66_9MICO|nr:hypothetical protein GCM10025866_33370 [Naasia aerilata]
MAAGFSGDAVRVDVWLWSVRLYKTRSLATAACRAGHVRVNGERAKPAQSVRVGDEVVARTDRDHILGVRSLLTKRVAASVAAEAVDDRTPLRRRAPRRRSRSCVSAAPAGPPSATAATSNACARADAQTPRTRSCTCASFSPIAGVSTKG